MSVPFYNIEYHKDKEVYIIRGEWIDSTDLAVFIKAFRKIGYNRWLPNEEGTIMVIGKTPAPCVDVAN